MKRICALAALVVLISPAARVATQPPATIRAEALNGLKFRTIGPATMSGRIVDIAVVESNTYTYYVASATGGLWKTTDNGTTFNQIFTRDAGPSLGCVTVAPSDPNTVWVGTGEATNRQ